MQIKFLGTGGAFDVDYLNSAALLEFKDKTILLDCGFTVYPTLVQKNLVSKIDYILLTHLHNDHTGSLASLLLHRHIIEKRDRLSLLYSSEQFRMQIQELLEIQLKDSEKYVEFVPLDQFEGIRVIDTYGQHSEGMQSYAYIFDDNTRIAYSGDLARPDVLFERLEKLPQLPTCVFHDITFDAENTGHAYYKKLLPYLNGYKTYGYHCDPTKNPPDNPIRLVFYEKSLMA
ncbi:MBL fold metallo-hydrolase [Botryobacter ruber]|uniref:MBL fold metallo-hydrolase n=1 Tax=Botryobacter ruber TaxID=2171629 RepID=UPI000E0AD256|nr:MBL fold metallo-hydrolase [Botryobacter ruber]